jgi:hypothetical protein
LASGVPTIGKDIEYRVMPYPWSIVAPDYEMEVALDIARDYLERTKQAYPFSETLKICADTILQSWRRGTRHRIRLANDAINAIERGRSPTEGSLQSFYPRVS